ncbi:MAG: hypothetical protein ICV64_06740 [Thermoleophilia bacterium]|nr:hypothetical protein [Thermoleophilia bacterium]
MSPRGRLAVAAALPLVAVAAGAAVVEQPDAPRPGAACAATVEPRVGPAGSIVLAADRRLWLADEAGDRFVAFDPETAASEEVRLPAGTRPHRVIGGPDGSLWFTSRLPAIGSVDPRTGRVRLHRLRGLAGARPDDLVFDREGRGVFFTDPGRGRLSHLDLETREVVEHSRGLPRNSGLHGLTVDLAGNLWVALPGNDAIARFAVRRSRFDRVVRFSPGSGPRHLLFLHRGEEISPLVYASLAGSGALGEYDIGSRDVRERPTGVPGRPGPAHGERGLGQLLVGPDATTLWVATGRPGVVRYDIRRGRLRASRCGLDGGAATQELVIGPEKGVWVTLGRRGGIARVD